RQTRALFALRDGKQLRMVRPAFQARTPGPPQVGPDPSPGFEVAPEPAFGPAAQFSRLLGCFDGETAGHFERHPRREQPDLLVSIFQQPGVRLERLAAELQGEFQLSAGGGS
ncbi:MAG: hypothetical protein ACK56I_35870, partial [bacterium]